MPAASEKAAASSRPRAEALFPLVPADQCRLVQKFRELAQGSGGVHSWTWKVVRARQTRASCYHRGMRRVSVVGIAGAGKSTLARELSQRLALPLLELDGIYHQANWTRVSDDEFRARVGEFVKAERWIIDGNYTSHGVTDVVWASADTVIWLDFPRSVVMRQILHRTFRRLMTREELWNGNRESLRGITRLDREDNIILWAWTQHAPTRARYEQLTRDAEWSHIRFFRLRSRADVQGFLSAEVLSSAGGGGYDRLAQRT